MPKAREVLPHAASSRANTVLCKILTLPPSTLPTVTAHVFLIPLLIFPHAVFTFVYCLVGASSVLLLAVLTVYRRKNVLVNIYQQPVIFPEKNFVNVQMNATAN